MFSFVFCLVGFVLSSVEKPSQYIHLSKIESLTFTNKYTKGQRIDPIPELNCIGDCNVKPDSVFCRNSGLEKETNEYQWNCEADLPDNVELKEVRVSCEGYTGPGDQYVVMGSCGLFYELFDQELHQEDHTSFHEQVVSRESEKSENGFSIMSSTMVTVIFGVVTFLFCFVCTNGNTGNETED